MGRYVHAHAGYGSVGKGAAAALTTVGIGVFAVAVAIAVSSATASAQSYGQFEAEDYEDHPAQPSEQEKDEYREFDRDAEPYAEACAGGAGFGNVGYATPVYRVSPYASAAGCGLGMLYQYGSS